MAGCKRRVNKRGEVRNAWVVYNRECSGIARERGISRVMVADVARRWVWEVLWVK